MHDQDSAKEIVHTVFIKLWERRDTISLDQPIRSYLYTAVHNRCLNYLRDRSKFAEQDAGDLEFLSGLTAPEESKIEESETDMFLSSAINIYNADFYNEGNKIKVSFDLFNNYLPQSQNSYTKNLWLVEM